VRHVHERGGSLFTPEAVELAKENVAREVAERRRLSYVAMTRARDRLFLVVPPSPGNGSAAVTMRRLLPSIGALAGTQVESAIPYLLISPPSPGRAASEPRASIDVPPFHDRAASSSGPLGISMTQLATFEQCPRRYRFIHELALDPSVRKRGATA
jgi:ATP-dependent helicase/nuclease subunit A